MGRDRARLMRRREWRPRKERARARREQHSIRMGELYQQWALDFVIEAVRAVYQDFGRRPDAYRELPEAVGVGLDEFRTKVRRRSEVAVVRRAQCRVRGAARRVVPGCGGGLPAARSMAYEFERSSDAAGAIATQAATHAIEALRVLLGGARRTRDGSASL